MGQGEDSDILKGYAEIGRFFRWTPDAAKHRVKTERIPTFHIGRTVCARRSTLTAWLAEREASGRDRTDG